MYLQKLLIVINFTSLCKESVKTELFGENKCAPLKGMLLLQLDLYNL